MRAAAAALVVALLAMAAGAAAAGDPAERALGRADAYASARALGPAADSSQTRLTAAAASLARGGRPVKIGIVLGPVGSPSLAVYARRLRKRLRFPGTVVLTTVAGSTAAAGPLSAATGAGELEASGVLRLTDPTERVIRAARLVAAPAPARAGRSATRSLAALLLLAGVGGAWAAAVGIRRERRRATARLAGERARAFLRLDALAARAADLGARGPSDPQTHAIVRRAEEAEERAREALHPMAGAEDIRRALQALEEGQAAAAEAAERMGERAPVEDPFAGLCGVNPGHGPASGLAMTADGSGPVPACTACAEAAARGDPPARRLAPSVRDGRPVPFAEAERA